MVSIDTALPSSNNSVSKQSIANDTASKQEGEGLFATMFSEQVNDKDESNELALLSIDKGEKIDDKSGKNLPEASESDLLTFNSDIKNKKATTIDSLSDSQIETLKTKQSSEDSFLSQIQASNKMSLTVSDEVPVNNIELKNAKFSLEQAIDVSNASVNAVGEKIKETAIKDDLKNTINIEEMATLKDESSLNHINLKELSYLTSTDKLKGDSVLNNVNLKEVSSLTNNDNLKDISDLNLKSDIKLKENNLELGKLSSIESGIASNNQPSQNALPLVKLDASLSNQLNQVLPELSVEQQNQLKQSLESALAKLETLTPSTEVVSEVEKLNAILLQVDELITKDKTSADHLIKTEPLNEASKKQANELVEAEKQGFEINMKTQSKPSENIISENSAVSSTVPAKNTTPIENNTSNLVPKSQEQNFALGKDKNDNANFQNAYASEDNDLVIEDDSLVNIKSSAELSNTTKVISSNNDTAIAAQIHKSHVNSIFNDVIRQLEPQPLTGLEVDPVTELTNSITSSQTSTSLSQKLEGEKLLQQPINIARSDAAKLLNERVSFMLSQHNPQADIRLDPPELGSMIIRIRTDAEQAQINFSVQNQEAKELLEDSMPKLKEMLAEQGIDLGESNIEQQQQGQDEQESTNGNQKSGPLSSNENDEEIATVKVAGNKLGGVDFYA